MSRKKPSRQPSIPARVLAGGAIALALAVAASFDSFQASRDTSRALADAYRIKAQAERLQPAREALGGAGRIGYLSDVARSEIAGAAAYGAVQFELAPRLLVTHENALPGDWVLGNFSRPQDYAAFGRPHSLRMVRDFGSGIVLYRQEAR